MLLDPERNVILMDGYNGGPRGGKGALCGDEFCERDGFLPQNITFERGTFIMQNKRIETVSLWDHGKLLTRFDSEDSDTARASAKKYVEVMAKAYPPIQSGTHMEIGCHHAEMNVICNAAANGVKTDGAWLIVTGEPCKMCAKMIHHAGIRKVIVVGGGYVGANGCDYLTKHGVEVEVVEGPKDPRSQKE